MTRQLLNTKYYQTRACIGRFCENVKEIAVYDLFGVKTTNCSVHIQQLDSNGRRKRYTIKSPVQ